MITAGLCEGPWAITPHGHEVEAPTYLAIRGKGGEGTDPYHIQKEWYRGLLWHANYNQACASSASVVATAMQRQATGVSHYLPPPPLCVPHGREALEGVSIRVPAQD